MLRTLTASTLRAILTAGILLCAAPQYRLYPGDPRPQDQVAIITEDPDAERTDVVQIDDLEVRGDAWEVLPGTHRVVIEARRRAPLELAGFAENQFVYFKAVCEMTLDARPGGRYIATSDGEFQGHSDKFRYSTDYQGSLTAWLAPKSSPAVRLGDVRCEVSTGDMFL